MIIMGSSFDEVVARFFAPPQITDAAISSNLWEVFRGYAPIQTEIPQAPIHRSARKVVIFLFTAYIVLRPRLSTVLALLQSLPLRLNDNELYKFSVGVEIVCLFMGSLVLLKDEVSLWDDEINWIDKQQRFLRAIVEDSRRVMVLSDETLARARQVWNIDPGREVFGLTMREKYWVNETEPLVSKANSFVNKYMQRRTNRSFLSSFMDWIDWRMKPVDETRAIKKEIEMAIKTMDVFRLNICHSLETSWSMIRKLLDRPIELHENECVQSIIHVSADESVSHSITLVDELIFGVQMLHEHFPSFDSYFIKLQLVLLHPFLIQIQGLKMESRLKDLWIQEIEMILREANRAIQCFMAGRGKFLWILRDGEENLTKQMNHIYSRFYELFNCKESFGFKFIRRDASKSTHTSLCQGVVADASFTIEKLGDFYGQESVNLEDAYIKLASLCYELKELLDFASPSESINDSRVASLKEAILYVAKTARLTTDSFRYQIFHESIERADRYVFWMSYKYEYCRKFDLLWRSIKAYEIELRNWPSSVVGLEEDIHQVVSQLTDSGEDSSVVCVLGMQGIGKTTLGRKIYNHRAVKGHFAIGEWITLPPERRSNYSLLEDVARKIRGPPLPDNFMPDMEHVREVWTEKIGESRYLLVLDNVSTVEDWDTLTHIFLPILNGSRILIITTNEELASRAIANPSRAPHQLRLRTKTESLILFKQLVHVSPEEEKVAEEIVDRCLGIPRDIVNVGYLTLWNNMNVSRMLEQLTLMNDHQPLAANLANIEIPSQLQICIDYLRLFPSDFEIPARRIIALWVAEGLACQSRDGNESSEDVANKYLSQLIDQNIIQVVKREPNGKVKTCCFPIAMRDIQLTNLPEAAMSIKRLADQFDRNARRISLIHRNILTDLGDYKGLQSFLSFDPREGDEPGEDIGNFLHRGIKSGCFLELQVIDLERVFRPKLPNSIGKLKRVRYLGLRWTYIESIPASVGNLVQLETLDVNHTDLRTLPVSVWKLQRLRHLHLNKSNRSKFIRNPRGSSLKNLETLWNVYVDASNPLKDFLDKLINIRKLGLSMQLDGQDDLLADQIAKMQHLRCLKVRSTDEMGKPRALLLRLSNLENLSVLELFGELRPSILRELPLNLTELSLSACRLSGDPMPVLEELQSLKLLCLYSNSYTGEEMTCSRGGFPQLLVLRIWKLQELKEWKVNERSLQNLRELEIRSCKKLNFPNGLQDLKALLELKLQDMPQAFTDNINIWDDVLITINN